MESTTTATYIRDDVKADLRQAALRGGTVRDLVQIIRDRHQLRDDGVVVVLAYLCRAFDTRLPLVLPVREFVDCDEDQEPYLRALRICFWFSANIRHAARSVDAWVSDEFRKQFPEFRAEDLENLHGCNGNSVQSCFSGQFPDSVYIRGKWDTLKSKHPQLSPTDDSIVAGIRDFACKWSQYLVQVGRTEQSRCRLGFWFDIQDKGPYYQIVACVEGLLDHVSRAEQPVDVTLP